MNRKLLALPLLSLTLLFTLAPVVAHGQMNVNQAIALIVGIGRNIARGLGWTIVVFAVIMFMVYGFLYITASGDPGKVQTANKALLWGAVGLGVGGLAIILPDIIIGITGFDPRI